MIESSTTSIRRVLGPTSSYPGDDIQPTDFDNGGMKMHTKWLFDLLACC
jgi:hypothetical protein